MAYRFGLLRTDVSAEADAHNAELLGPSTLGIEVTTEPFIARCGLGNLNSQHMPGGGPAAIEEALLCPLPPDGSTLVTIRPDKDSIGAMAVLHLRLFKKDATIDKLLVSWIGTLDNIGGKRAHEEFPDLAEYFRNSFEAEALNVIANGSRWPDIEAKVRDSARLLSKQMPKTEVDGIARMHKNTRETFDVEMYGAIAFILAPGKYRVARQWGNFRHDIVLVHDPEVSTPEGPCSRWSVVRRTDSFNLARFTEDVNMAEAKARGLSVEVLKDLGLSWGGNQSITSSPTGVGRSSKLLKPEILRLVDRNVGT